MKGTRRNELGIACDGIMPGAAVGDALGARRRHTGCEKLRRDELGGLRGPYRRYNHGFGHSWRRKVK